MTTTRTLVSTLIVAAAVVGLAASSARGGGLVPIEDVNDPRVQELGRWAVSEHVKQAGDGLVFIKVVSGMVQPTAGPKFYLAIQATKGGAGITCQAQVWEKPDGTRQLLSFSPAIY